jgi:hypothetical protein
MKKDIFIDTNVAKNFANPMDPAYKALLKWLMSYPHQGEDVQHLNPHLAVSQKLLNEYKRSSMHAYGGTSIGLVVDLLTKQGRLHKISKNDCEAFKAQHFTKTVEKKLACNHEDRELLPVVLLSHRKFALTRDDNFTHDLLRFPGFIVTVAKKPEDLPYAD